MVYLDDLRYWYFIHDEFCTGLKSPRLLPNRFYLPSQLLLEMLQLAHHALHNGSLVSTQLRYILRHTLRGPGCNLVCKN